MYPSEHGSISDSGPLDYPGNTLAERLSSAGFTTRGFSANPFITPAFKFDRGFDSFDGPIENLPLFDDVFNWNAFHEEHTAEGPVRFLKAVIDCARADVDTVRSLRVGAKLAFDHPNEAADRDSGIKAATEWLRNQRLDSDEFLFFNLMEAHAPYDKVPSEYVSGTSLPEVGLQHHFDQPEQSELRSAYDSAVAYLSDAYETLFTELSDEMDYIVTLGDHGELLGEHGYYGHEYGLYPELTHVPLVLWGDDGLERTPTKIVSLLDVHATVLDWAGVAAEADGRGTSLTRDTTDSEYLVEGHGLPSARVEKLTNMGHGISEYDMLFRGVRTMDAYGYQTADGWHTEGGSDLAALRELLEDLSAGLESRDSVSGRSELPDEVRKRLEANGYA